MASFTKNLEKEDGLRSGQVGVEASTLRSAVKKLETRGLKESLRLPGKTSPRSNSPNDSPPGSPRLPTLEEGHPVLNRAGSAQEHRHRLGLIGGSSPAPSGLRKSTSLPPSMRPPTTRATSAVMWQSSSSSTRAWSGVELTEIPSLGRSSQRSPLIRNAEHSSSSGNPYRSQGQGQISGEVSPSRRNETRQVLTMETRLAKSGEGSPHHGTQLGSPKRDPRHSYE